MLRRTFQACLAGSALAVTPALARPRPRFQPAWDSLQTHELPQWFDDAKFGIFIHWGLYSVPAWAPPTGELGKVDPAKWFYQNPYAEWYLNTLRLKDTPTAKHHAATYGADFDYYKFADTFNRDVAKWDPKEWATLFRKVGAKYAVLTTKHHDGFTLWPSKVPNPRRSGLNMRRDLVGDLTSAVRAEGLHMGLYYSGGLDWTFNTTPVGTMKSLRETIPQTAEYARYADAHWAELVKRYRPDVLWNDIGYPKAGRIPQLFADYYNRQPAGLVNNRFSAPFADFTTPEYANYDKITEKKWESCRGLGFSFGYNQVEGPEHVLTTTKLVRLLVDIVSKNGNLLLNIGPRPDGSISDIQKNRLEGLGKWLAVNGEGIFASRPWERPSGKTAAGEEMRFTRKEGSLYAWILGTPKDRIITLPNFKTGPRTRVGILGVMGDVSWDQNGRNLDITVPKNIRLGEHCVGLKITPVPELVTA